MTSLSILLKSYWNFKKVMKEILAYTAFNSFKVLLERITLVYVE
ncbi:hypothetical protein TSIB_1484 [Thermococcus sibiricus MM 739]|uniref:Uncharacterized protein n=1 Tax=Thermococcus sibiricus (strain DSM 12597 / MM 739) TaxID=604354 RepID=C6A4J0_THESM|nr:hypothetical protein TSIB_1484 [Thermococcus sibiricus MM 739]